LTDSDLQAVCLTHCLVVSAKQSLVRRTNRRSSGLAISPAAFRTRFLSVVGDRAEWTDRSFEQQRYRASGLNLVTAAIVLWNIVYLERAIQKLREMGKPIDTTLLQYL